MPLGNILAQLVHAAGESSPGNLPPNTHAVVLAVQDEPELLDIHYRLLQGGIQHVLIREPDAPFNGAATAIGLYPVLREEVRQYLKKLSLFK